MVYFPRGAMSWSVVSDLCNQSSLCAPSPVSLGTLIRSIYNQSLSRSGRNPHSILFQNPIAGTDIYKGRKFHWNALP